MAWERAQLQHAQGLGGGPGARKSIGRVGGTCEDGGGPGTRGSVVWEGARPRLGRPTNLQVDSRRGWPSGALQRYRRRPEGVPEQISGPQDKVLEGGGSPKPVQF